MHRHAQPGAAFVISGLSGARLFTRPLTLDKVHLAFGQCDKAVGDVATAWANKLFA